jgi:ferredoxin
VLRARLQKLSDRIAEAVGPFGHRVFTDSAPVLEAELAARSGQGWRGKHTLVLNREAGSMFFLGEIYVDMALPPSEPVTAHCGSCSACIDVCPTQAIIAPHRLDARRCISYLTIEHAANPDRAAPVDWPTASMAATTASWSAPGTSLPRSAACRISTSVTSARAWRASSWCICLPGTRPPSCA